MALALLYPEGTIGGRSSKSQRLQFSEKLDLIAIKQDYAIAFELFQEPGDEVTPFRHANFVWIRFW